MVGAGLLIYEALRLIEGKNVRGATATKAQTAAGSDTTLAPATGGSGQGVQLSLEQRVRMAYQAGFRGNDLVTIVSISEPESGGGWSEAKNPNSTGTGVLQFLDTTFPNRDAIDPQKSFNYAYDLVYRQGRGFLDWCPYVYSSCPGWPTSGWDGVKAVYNQTRPKVQAIVDAQGYNR